jgi:DnaJ-class molecular chaperone
MSKKFKDKEIECLQCGNSFTWTAGEQKFYEEKGLDNQPKTCPTCRDNRKKETAYEVECQECQTKGHIKTANENQESLNKKLILCKDCADEKKEAKLKS